ncbi:hypothetical protein X975_06124, partial [Stegodyphus mimosarum]
MTRQFTIFSKAVSVALFYLTRASAPFYGATTITSAGHSITSSASKGAVAWLFAVSTIPSSL